MLKHEILVLCNEINNDFAASGNYVDRNKAGADETAATPKHLRGDWVLPFPNEFWGKWATLFDALWNLCPNPGSVASDEMKAFLKLNKDELKEFNWDKYLDSFSDDDALFSFMVFRYMVYATNTPMHMKAYKPFTVAWKRFSVAYSDIINDAVNG